MMKCPKYSKEKKLEGNSFEYITEFAKRQEDIRNLNREILEAIIIDTEIHRATTNLLNCQIVSILPNKASKTSLDNSNSEFSLK